MYNWYKIIIESVLDYMGFINLIDFFFKYIFIFYGILSLFYLGFIEEYFYEKWEWGNFSVIY